MSFLKKIFGKKDAPIKSYEDFWNWFKENEAVFFNVVKGRKNIEKLFLDTILSKLNELGDGYFVLTGMYDDNTVELVITADGSVKHFVFVEELINAAPHLSGWKFTALKPALDIEDVNIEMAGYKFSQENLFFYTNNLPAYPDEIDVTVVHNDLNEDNKDLVSNGCYIFLDNYLGELAFATTIDNTSIIKKSEAAEELIPIAKLKDFLKWRQKEFIEKYESVRHNTENDKYSILEAELKNGNHLIAVINTDLLNWDSKASHPWILNVELKYDGTNFNGMPDKKTNALMNEIEDEITNLLKDTDGYLNIGRQTADNSKEIYFACREFRKPSKVLFTIQQKYLSQIKLDYDIYKDKYWQSFKRFEKNV